MSKVKIEYKINEISKKNIIGVLNKNKIVFKFDSEKIAFTMLEDSVNIEKENSDGILNLSLGKNNIGNYNINKIGNIVLDPVLNHYEFIDNKLSISYKLNDNDIDIELKYEVIE